MGCHENITFDKFPKQGPNLGKLVEVIFHYDTSKKIKGRIVRDDYEEPGRTIIALDRAADSCLARAAKEGGRMITVGEYIAWRQPGILDILENWRRVESHPSLQWWARLMTERPLPGRAGLLPGEKAV